MALHAVLVWAVRVGWLLAGLAAWDAASLRIEQGETPLWPYGGLFGVYGMLVLVRYRRAWPPQVRAAAMCAVLMVLAGLASTLYGSAPAVVLLLAFAVLCGGLFLGLPGLVVTLAATTAEVLGIGWFLELDLGGAAPLGTSFRGWPRAALEYACVSSMIAVVGAHVVRRIEAAHAEALSALDRLREEEERRASAQAELHRVRRKLKDAQRLQAVGRLAAGVGHDFNNTLQVVLAWASQLREEVDQPALLEGLVAIERAASSGSELPRRLVSFGRKGAARREVVDLGQAIGDFARSLSRLLPADIVVERELRGAARVRVDRARLDQVLLNLGINARDAMPNGGTLTIGCERVEPRDIPAHRPPPEAGGRWAHVWVSDTGQGIAEGDLPQVFEPFFTTKGDGGSGIGLTSVHSLVKKGGGFVRVDAGWGVGATFHVYLPECEPQQALAESEAPAAAAARSATVLLVEDQPDVRRSMVRALCTHGHEVIAFASARQALAALEEHARQTDVLCVDAITPGGGTPELIDRFRGLRPGGQVLICSGYLEADLRRRRVDLRGCSYLAKPFSAQRLVSEVMHLASRGAPRRKESA